MKQFSLKNLRVLNTRPLGQHQSLSQAIEEAGGIAIHCPALAIEATSITAWLPTLPSLETFNQAIFTSANAVNFFLHALNQSHLSFPKNIIVSAVGEATAKALANHHLSVAMMPEVENSEGLLTLTHLQTIKQQHILLVKGIGGRPLISQTLFERGAQLTLAEVYQRVLPALNAQKLECLWQNDAVDIILVTSQQALEQLFILFGTRAKTWLQQKPCLVISPRLAKAASSLGMQTIIVSDNATIIDALDQFNQGLNHGR